MYLPPEGQTVPEEDESHANMSSLLAVPGQDVSLARPSPALPRPRTVPPRPRLPPPDTRIGVESQASVTLSLAGGECVSTHAH